MATIKRDQIASRIETLRAQQQTKTEAKLEISRDRILQELADMALAPATLSGSHDQVEGHRAASQTAGLQ
jgi:hypothetical protein